MEEGKSKYGLGLGSVVRSVNFRSSVHLYRQAIQVINDGKDELGAVSSFLLSLFLVDL